MNQLNNTTDVQKYLEAGPMTQPFLKDKKLDGKISKASSDKEKVKILLKYLHKKNRVAFNKDFIRENKFHRTAEESWKSGKMTGCTDWAMCFASIARQYGISTSFFTTAEKDWTKEVLGGKFNGRARGHSFCECFIDGKWQLVDPTMSKIQEEYDTDNLHLTAVDHFVGGKKDFIPYYRGLDIGERTNVSEFIGKMVDAVQSLNEQEKQPKKEPVTAEELKQAGFVKDENDIEIIKYKEQEGSNDLEQES